MANHEPPEHLHLLDSFELGWDRLNLIYEIEPADEMAELVRQLQVNDPLIEQMGLAMMAEVKIGGASSRLYIESMTTALTVHLLRRYCSRSLEIKQYTDGLLNIF